MELSKEILIRSKQPMHERGRNSYLGKIWSSNRSVLCLSSSSWVVRSATMSSRLSVYLSIMRTILSMMLVDLKREHGQSTCRKNLLSLLKMDLLHLAHYSRILSLDLFSPCHKWMQKRKEKDVLPFVVFVDELQDSFACRSFCRILSPTILSNRQ